MGIIKKIVTYGAVGLATFMLGKSCTGESNNYIQGMKLQEDSEKVQLYNAPLDKSYQLNIIGEEVFLGGPDHNMLGFKTMTEEAMKQKYVGD